MCRLRRPQTRSAHASRARDQARLATETRRFFHRRRRRPDIVRGCFGRRHVRYILEQSQLSFGSICETHGEVCERFSVATRTPADTFEIVPQIQGGAGQWKYADASEFLHHFTGEESKHMWFFAQFCLRYGGKLYPAQRTPKAHSVDHLSSAARELTVLALPDIAREINRVHHG
ncbi:hypothetical protein [Streptomyces sp. NPDC005336]|uniref:hypothetical protein n=1 Tax=Streptomyces sp. NPDC005336 TaxID=3157035 RepID=UPI0033AD1CC1